jgi:hypothetical protein
MKRSIGILGIYLMLVTSAMAGTILYGTVRIDPYLPSAVLYDSNGSHYFPLLTYRFRPDVHDLKYDKNVPEKDRVKHINRFKLPLEATLNLVSFDKKTYVTKFQLTLFERNWLAYVGPKFFAGVYFETGGDDLKGGGLLKLADGSETIFIIEGKFDVINDKPVWISLHRNKYFDIEIDKSDYGVWLKLLQDLPVIVST